MKYKVENKKGQVLISFSIDAKEWEAAVESVYQKTKGKYSHVGFRKGHVPRKVLENTYGKGFFYEDAFNEAFPKYYYEVLDKESEIYPVDRPDVDVKSIDDKGVKFTALVTVKPEVTLGEYKGLKVEKHVDEVTDQAVEAELALMADKNARMVVVSDRAVQNGDEVVIDYSGSVDGVKFDGGTAEKQTLVIGSGRFIPGFEEQIVGMNTGDEKDITVKFPEDYHAENLKGKDAVFAVKLHEIKYKQLPVMDDEFAKDVSEFDTLDELKADIRKKLEDANERAASTEFENKLIDTVIENMEGEIPTEMYEVRIDEMIRDFEYRLQSQGMSLDLYLQYTGMNRNSFRKTFEAQAQRQVKIRLALEKIVELENIVPTEEEVEQEYTRLAEGYKMDVERLKGLIPAADVTKDVAVNKAIDMIRDSAVAGE